MKAKFASWYRFLYNGYEPDNEIKLTGKLTFDELTTDKETYVVFEMWGSVTFNDGHSFVSIHQNENGKFVWRKGNEMGIAASFMHAWNKMPLYITSPDHYEESPMTYYNQSPSLNNPDYRPVYYCDFRKPDGSQLVTEQPVNFVDQPSYFVVVEGVGFRKTWESGNRVVYTQVSMTDLTNEVSING